MLPPVDHDCSLLGVVTELSNQVEKLRHELAQLKKAHIGPKSERSKLPRVPTKSSTPEERLAKRRANATDRAQTETVRTEHKVPDEQRCCPSCGNAKLKPIGAGRTTTVYEFVPARFVRHEHVQEVLRCKCGDYVVTAPGAPKVIEKGRYGSSLLAHLAVAKCADHFPLYRLEKDFARRGFPLARSTMNELLHRTSELTAPLWQRLLELIRVRPVVGADETRLLMQNDGTGKPKNGFVWTFVAADERGEQDVGGKHLRRRPQRRDPQDDLERHQRHADRGRVQRLQRRREGLAAQTRSVPRAPAALLSRGAADGNRSPSTRSI